eukprot:6943523-Prorocentrum_lima.AAC.1
MESTGEHSELPGLAGSTALGASSSSHGPWARWRLCRKLGLCLPVTQGRKNDPPHPQHPHQVAIWLLAAVTEWRKNTTPTPTPIPHPPTPTPLSLIHISEPTRLDVI